MIMGSGGRVLEVNLRQKFTEFDNCEYHFTRDFHVVGNAFTREFRNQKWRKPQQMSVWLIKWSKNENLRKGDSYSLCRFEVVMDQRANFRHKTGYVNSTHSGFYCRLLLFFLLAECSGCSSPVRLAIVIRSMPLPWTWPVWKRQKNREQISVGFSPYWVLMNGAPNSVGL